jgi:DNA-binding PadR family transcriptional regulator
MEQDVWISSKWEVTDKGRNAKLYSITLRGKKQLVEEEKTWGAIDAWSDKGAALFLAFETSYALVFAVA